MNRTISLIFTSTWLLFFASGSIGIHANPQSLEKVFDEIGYKPVGEALEDAERHFRQKLTLPIQVPPISFTHHFGRFNDLEDDINDSFEAVWINEASPGHHYKIDIRPVVHKIPFSDKRIVKTFTLQDDGEALYIEIAGFYALVFEKKGWQYVLSVDKRVAAKVPPDVLVDLANSIEY